MSEHVKDLLSAYSDGELSGGQLARVENHLGKCAECQAELALLRDLSSLLHKSAPVGDFLPTERFISNLNLKLPRQPEKPPARKFLEISWWLTPFGVLGVWVFLQVTFGLSALLINASNAGLLGGGLAWLGLGSAMPQTEWFGLLNNWFGAQLGLSGQSALFGLNNTDLFFMGLLNQVFWQALLALVYLGWLASWWYMRPAQLTNSGSMDFNAR